MYAVYDVILSCQISLGGTFLVGSCSGRLPCAVLRTFFSVNFRVDPFASASACAIVVGGAARRGVSRRLLPVRRRLCSHRPSSAGERSERSDKELRDQLSWKATHPPWSPSEY
eukprot:1834321-Pleurochrysis_carterae.AAC.1